MENTNFVQVFLKIFKKNNSKKYVIIDKVNNISHISYRTISMFKILNFNHDSTYKVKLFYTYFVEYNILDNMDIMENYYHDKNDIDDNIIFQSSSLKECKEHLDMLINVNKYNL